MFVYINFDSNRVICGFSFQTKSHPVNHAYLLYHPADCGCPMCSNAQHKYLMFRIACAYAWYVYLNDEQFKRTAKREVFTGLFDYWQNHRKGSNAFPKNDQFYLDSAQMLMWYSHYEWKWERNYGRSKELLQSALKGLDKVQHHDRILKQLIVHSIESLDSLIEKQSQTKNIHRKLGYDERQQDEASKPKKSKQTLPQKVNLLDMIKNDDTSTPDAKNVKFQIHDDESAGPPQKKSRRCREKKN